MRGSCKSCWMGILLLAAAIAPAADKLVYRIRFERGFSAGQIFAFNFSDSLYQSQKVLAPDSLPKQSENMNKLALAGELKIIAVNEKGQETEQLLTIQRFVKQSGPGLPEALAKPDTQIRITYDKDKGIFTAVKGTMSDDAHDALRQVFKPRASGAVTDDERFGTAANKSVGDTWPVNVKAVTRGGPVAPKNVSGTVTLKGIKIIAGVECAEVTTDLEMKDVPVADGEAKENTLRAAMSCLLPTDPGLPVMATTVKLTTRLVAEQPSSAGGVLQTINETQRENTVEWKPVALAK